MRPTRSRTGFTRFAKWTARAAGRPVTFAAACALIGLWAITGPVFGYSDAWQLVINTGTTIITFLVVFLIQSTQNRDSEAIQVKLDALLDLEELEEEELDAIRAEYCRIAEEARARLRRGEHDTDVPEVAQPLSAVKHEVRAKKREIAELKKRV